MSSRTIEVQIVGDAASLERSLGKAQASLGRFGASAARTGAAMTRTLTLPIVAAGAAATKYTYDFDQSMNHIGALVGVGSKQLDHYRSEILKLAPAVGQGPKELADALYFITSSGFKGAAALKVLTASAKGAASGLGDTKTIADLVTSAVNVYGQKNLSAAHAVDVLTQAVKDGKGEPADYAVAMGRVIPVAQNLGVSFDQVGAALAALTLGGFSADKATTGLQSIFTNLSKPTTTGAAELKKMGLSYAGIRQEIKDKGLLSALLDMNKAFDGNSIALRKVFSSGKAIVPFLSLTGQAAQKNIGIFHDLATSSGASQQAFAKQSQTTAFQVQQALAKIQVAAVQVGSVILPVFAKLATGVADLSARFGELSPGMQEVVLGAAVGVAALGPLLSVIGNVSKSLNVMKIAAIGASGEGGLLALARANPEVALVSLGVAATALAIHFLNARDASNAVTEAFKRQIAAIDDLVTATLTAKNDHLAYRQAQLDVKTTAIAVTQAQHAENKAVAQYGTTSLQARQAMLQLTQARIDHQSALIRETAAGDKWTSSVEKQNKEMYRLRDGINSARAAVVKQLQDFQRSGSVRGLSDYTQGLANARDHLAKLAAEARTHGLPALADLATKLSGNYQAMLTLSEASSIVAGKMSTLKQRIDALPTKKDIYIYTHFVSLQNTGNPGPSGGDHRGSISPHTGGVVTLAGGLSRFAYGGLVTGGVRGRDSVPALLTPGERVLTSQEQWQLFHRGAGSGEAHIHLHGGTFIGTTSRDVAKQLAQLVSPELSRLQSRRA